MSEENELHEVMTREIHVMREMLANMHLEQKAIMQRDCASLLLITENRTALLSVMQRLRSLILSKIDNPSTLEECEVSHMKDQIITLVDKIQSCRQNNRSLGSGPVRMPLPKPEKAKVKVMTITEH